MVTAEVQTKHYKNGTSQRFIYYHCTRKNKQIACRQKFIRQPELNSQLSQLIHSVRINDHVAGWFRNRLEQDKQDSRSLTEKITTDLNGQIGEQNLKLEKLMDLYLSGLTERDEYLKRRKQIIMEKAGLNEKVIKIQKDNQSWLEPMENWINLAANAEKTSQLTNGLAKKRDFLLSTGSNLTLEDKKVCCIWPIHWARLAARPTDRGLERVSRIELPSPPWKGGILPLYYTRALLFYHFYGIIGLMFSDILVAVLSQLDVLSGAVIAVSYGFFLLPSAFGYLAGVIGSLATGSITPVSFMYESMVLSFALSKKLAERISMILLAAALTGILGLFGLPQMIVDRVGPEIFFAVLAGVGLYLARVGVDLAKDNLKIGLPCFITAMAVQLLTTDLIWTVTVSISLGLVINLVLKRPSAVKIPAYRTWREMRRRELKLIRPVINRKSVVGALALSVLTIGGNVAYVAANHQLAGSGTPTYNQATVISGAADLVSSLFGGANMELIVSPTAAAPDPLRAGIIFMALAALLLLSGAAYKIIRWVPVAAMGGYLFVIGAILILPYNAADAFRLGDPVTVGLALAITYLTNPFYGLAAGSLVKVFLGAW